jgi:hypothetical protein
MCFDLEIGREIPLGPLNESFEEQIILEEGNFTMIEKESFDTYTTDIRVFHDNKRKVTCWELRQGLSCIPDHLLKESEAEEE